MNDNELGEWDVDVNVDDTGITLGFTHFGESGVERFDTGLPREQAMALAVAILNAALELPAVEAS